MLCVTCGGNGYFLEIQGFPTIHNKGVLMPCECENGYKYTKFIDEHGKK